MSIRLAIHTILFHTIILFFVTIIAHGEQPRLSRPVAGMNYGALTRQLAQPGHVVVKPDKDMPEWWAGAPSAVRDQDGIFWMACRMRSGEGERGLRGYEIRLLRSEDGVTFHKDFSIKREDVPIPGFERPALLIDPATQKFKLYTCGPWQGGPWSIIKFDDAGSPCEFIAQSARPVIAPREKTYERDQPPVEYKDPVIIHAEGAYHCYVIGYVRKNERIFHFTSTDGETWEPVGNPYEPIMELSGWHDFFVRPSCVVPTGAGYLFVYEGSKSSWYDPVYNISTGLAYTFDLHHIIELTTDAPLAVSPTPNEHFSTFRYSSWVRVDDQFYIYAEVATPNNTHEIRLFRI
ncbi:MAG: hypothetical protein SGI88_15700 [Candidatus Hydrogenedentes bacterium]|nr:hypothetical protein [Candidatus Hydrogenedentota bacterium]